MWWPRKSKWTELLKAVGLWFCLSLSLAGYYAASGSRWPLPVPEAVGAFLLHRFSLPVPEAIQSLHWFLTFPIAGIIWVSTLVITAPYFGSRRVEYIWTLERFSLATVPMLLPLPVIIYIVGPVLTASTWRVMLAAGLQRLGHQPHPWLTPVFLVLAIAGLIWQIILYTRIFEIKGRAAVRHLLFCFIVFAITATGLATLLGVAFHNL